MLPLIRSRSSVVGGPVMAGEVGGLLAGQAAPTSPSMPSAEQIWPGVQ